MTEANLLPKIEVLYEGSDYLIVNKPAGLLSAPVGGGQEPSVIGELQRRKPKSHLFLVHRLDRETSGVLLVAKTAEAALRFKNLFRRRLMKKRYLAKVEGRLLPPEGEINLPLKVLPRLGRTVPAAVGSARWARTRYQVERYEEGATWVWLFPTTGRTHQLRAHLSAIGHPVVGDVKYGAKPAARLFLHASALSFKDPNGQAVTGQAPLPVDFR